MQTLKMITDIQFECMGLAIGQIGKIKALTAEIKGAQLSEGITPLRNIFRTLRTQYFLPHRINISRTDPKSHNSHA